MDKKLESVLDEINSFGKYQLINFTLLCIPVFISAIYEMVYVFSAGTPTFRCKIPECEGDTINYYNGIGWIENAVPFDTNNDMSSCFRYGMNKNISVMKCLSENFNKSNIIPCSEYVFENVDEISIANEWNLLCRNNEWKLTMVGSMTSIGQFFGLGVSGYFSDKYGRKVILLMSTVASGVFGIVKASSQGYIMFISLEFVENVFTAGLYPAAFILGEYLLNEILIMYRHCVEWKLWRHHGL